MKLDSIKIFSISYDSKINAHNVAFEMSKKDYLAIAPEIKENNELQRKRVVKKTSSVYSLMKKDLQEGCLIPPIVLSLEYNGGNNNFFKIENKNDIINFISQNYRNIKILDGLQRTNMLIDVHKELSTKTDLNNHRTLFYKENLRFEMYIGANLFGILYRMLTLNTGQTPMTIPHQMEMLYADLYENEKDGIVLIREKDTTDEKRKDIEIGLGVYKFYDMIEGMESYLQNDEFTTDRFDILEYVKNVQKISTIIDSKDTFEEFIKVYHSFVEKINYIFTNIKFSKEDLEADEAYLFEGKKPFGENAVTIFIRSQAITGFGAAISNRTMIEVGRDIQKIHIQNSPQYILNRLIVRLADIGNNSAGNIGSSQRRFFRIFFTELLDKESGFDIEKAIEMAFRRVYKEKLKKENR